LGLKELTTNVRNALMKRISKLQQPLMILKGNQHWTYIRFERINKKCKKHTQEAHLEITATVNN
jgi:hypothetical protein